VQINWCLKGIAESGSFKDAEAADVLASTGILSNWIRTNGGTSAHQANISGQKALTASARRSREQLFEGCKGHALHIPVIWMLRISGR
jgi:hypothetical protein